MASAEQMPGGYAPHPDGYDAFEKDARSAESTKEARFQRKKARMYRETFGTPAGKFVLRELVAMCKMFGVMYTPGMDGMQLAHNEGRREVVTYLFRHARITDAEIEEIRRVHN